MSKENNKEGYQAYNDGLDHTDCPHMPGTQEYEDWMNGWEEAEADASEAEGDDAA